MTANHEAENRGLCQASEAGRRAGLDVRAARLLRVRSSVHVELPHADTVVRIERPGEKALAQRQVAVALALAESGAPVARLIRPEIQPLQLEDGCTVTLWRRLRPVAEPRLAEVGKAVREVHRSTAGLLPEGVPAIEPFERIEVCLDSPSPWSGSREIEALRDRARRLEQKWRDVARSDPLGAAVVHGDPHLDNAVMTENGLVLLDLEDSGIGPASWDFVPLAVGVSRYGLAVDDFREFASGYGNPPQDWPGHAVMCQVYELVVTSWAIRCSPQSSLSAKEAAVRVAGVLDDDPTPWTLI